jgi:hypothetical protein
MDIKLYGQADFYYAVSKQILSRLVDKGLITDEQRIKIDVLNRQDIYKRYASIAELEVSS